MRSKIAQKIVNETDDKVKEKVNLCADLFVYLRKRGWDDSDIDDMLGFLINKELTELHLDRVWNIKNC